MGFSRTSIYTSIREKKSRETMATISIPNPAPSAIEDAEKLRMAFQGTVHLSFSQYHGGRNMYCEWVHNFINSMKINISHCT